MEYNYTREWKQPHKVYAIGTINLSRFFPEGVKVSFLIGIGVIAGLVFGSWLLSLVFGITFLSNLFRQTWIVLIFFLSVGLWVLFSLSWDKKRFSSFLMGRFKATARGNTQTEHGHKVGFMETPLQFVNKRKKGRVYQWKPK